MDFKTLKKNSGQAYLDKVAKEMEQMNNPFAKETDNRFWYPEVDSSGNGSAVIRFLPGAAVDGEDAPEYVRLFHHSFQHPETSRWYIENSLTTLKQPDPVTEYNSKLWNSTKDEESPARKQARHQKRKLTFYSNIYVISDPRTPENEGKVFLYRYGKKIYDKLDLLMHPEFEGDPRINPFDLWSGANLKMRIRTKAGYRNYDESVFDSPGPLFSDDKKIEAVWKQAYSLKEIVAPDKFKSYDELEKRLKFVLGEEEDEIPFDTTPARAPSRAPSKSDAGKSRASSVIDDDLDFDLDEFKELADD